MSIIDRLCPPGQVITHEEALEIVDQAYAESDPSPGRRETAARNLQITDLLVKYEALARENSDLEQVLFQSLVEDIEKDDQIAGLQQENAQKDSLLEQLKAEIQQRIDAFRAENPLAEELTDQQIWDYVI